LQDIPSEISMMSGLNKLNVTNNRLQDVPVELGQLSRLTHFDYSGNPFSAETQQKIINIMSNETTTAPKKPAVKRKRAIQKKRRK
jgi:Leucine-rich repeat (LRR) protein